MEAWESIQETLNYIESNLKDAIDIRDLAKQAHLSPYYYQKLFHRLVGKPVMEYIKLRCLAHIADKLRLEGGKILDLAVEYGFNNHETLSRSFKDTYGITPECYRKQPVFLSHFIMPDLSIKYRLIDEGVPLAANGIILEINRCILKSHRLFAGVCVQNPINDTPGVDLLGELWRRYREQFGSTIPNRTDGGWEAGISYEGRKEGHFTYFAGAEVYEHADEWLKSSNESEQHENKQLPAGEYIVCTFEAENFHDLTTNALNKAVGYLFGTWLSRHGLVTEGFLAEIYDKRCLGVSEDPVMDIMVKLKD